MRAFFDRFCQGFVDLFGSPASFTFWAVLFVLWVLPMPLLGWTRWNGGLGLFGNTTESTAELFLGIATLYVANKIDARHDRQLERIEQLERTILEELRRDPPS